MLHLTELLMYRSLSASSFWVPQEWALIPRNESFYPSLLCGCVVSLMPEHFVENENATECKSNSIRRHSFINLKLPRSHLTLMSPLSHSNTFPPAIIICFPNSADAALLVALRAGEGNSSDWMIHSKREFAVDFKLNVGKEVRCSSA